MTDSPAADPTKGMSPLQLYHSDYRAQLRRKPPESTRRSRLLALPRLLVSPSLQALLAIRLANASPRAIWWFWRNCFVRLHSMDWSGPLLIGPGLELPHPIGVLLVRGAVIGSDVALGHNVTLGGARDGGTPRLGDRVTIYPGAVIVGGITIGADSIISANSVVTRNVPPGRILTPRGVLPLAALRSKPTAAEADRARDR